MISVWMMTKDAGEAVTNQVLWMIGAGIFTFGLLAACIMDLKEQMVYRFWWLVAGLGATVLLVLKIQQEGMTAGALVDLVFFMLLQQTWFNRFYGRADCHAYCVCAVALAAIGLTLTDYVMHMLITFAGLAVVQLFKRNVEVDGRLKKPVALIPYIMIAFWVWVDFKCGKWYI